MVSKETISTIKLGREGFLSVKLSKAR